MPGTKSIDFVIAGLGLAGAGMALQLLSRGKRVLAFDTPEVNRASRVAAGMFNPATGKFIAKAWQAELLFPYLHKFYREAERTTGASFYSELPLYIPFRTIEEQNDWTAQGTTGSMSAFTESVLSQPQFEPSIHNPLGGLTLRGAGYIDTTVYLDAVRNLLADKGMLGSGRFNRGLLKHTDSGLAYDGDGCEAVILCTGLHALDDPLTSWLPLQPLKGETIDIKTTTVHQTIFNRGVYIIPGSQVARVGATYERGSSPGATEKGKQELIDRLETLYRLPYEIMNHSWGVRPTVGDRRPILGPHPKYPKLVIFNGMGTKGVSQSPYFSHVLADHLLGKTQLPKEVNISRFYTLYSKSRD